MPAIKKPFEYFNVVTYTGTGSTQSITGVGFQPDFVWTKARSSAESHRLYDSVRGATKSLFTNSTNAESTESQALTSFDADGFTLGSGAPNTSGVTYVAWCWKANGSGSSNTAGSITSTVSANTTSGFSVVTYTGTGSNATVGHGLGVVPKMIIAKSRSISGSSWPVYTQAVGATATLFLERTDAPYTNSIYWNNTSPTSSVFSIGTTGNLNSSGGTYVAYCFSEVSGYSKFGSYTGNGSTDGPFIYTGFKPRYVLFKNSSTSVDWKIFDAARNTYNVVTQVLYPNLSNAEDANTGLDFTSNGFKVRDNGTAFNGNGNTIIYACFAENPFKYSLAR